MVPDCIIPQRLNLKDKNFRVYSLLI